MKTWLAIVAMWGLVGLTLLVVVLWPAWGLVIMRPFDKAPISTSVRKRRPLAADIVAAFGAVWSYAIGCQGSRASSC